MSIGTTGVAFTFNKVEGVTLLDGMAGVALVNDNDFGFAQPDDLMISPAPDPTEQLRFYAPRPSGAACERHRAGRSHADVLAGDVWRNGRAVGFLRVAARRDAGRGCRREPPDAVGGGRRRADQLPRERHARGRAVRAPAATQTSVATAAVADFETGPAGPEGLTGPRIPHC